MEIPYRIKIKHILFSILIFCVRIECALRFFFLFVLLREFCFSENPLSSTGWIPFLLLSFAPTFATVFSFIFISADAFFVALLWSSLFVVPYLIGFSIYEFSIKKENVCINPKRRRITDLFAYWIILSGCIFFNGFFDLTRPLGEWGLLFLSSLVGAIFFSFGWEYLSLVARRIIFWIKNVW